MPCHVLSLCLSLPCILPWHFARPPACWLCLRTLPQARQLRPIVRCSGLKRTSSGVAPSQTKPKKGPKREVHEFRPVFVSILWCFSLGKQARFTLNFCSGMPLCKAHELTFLWFGLPGPLLIYFPPNLNISKWYFAARARRCLDGTFLVWTTLWLWNCLRQSTGN